MRMKLFFEWSSASNVSATDSWKKLWKGDSVLKGASWAIAELVLRRNAIESPQMNFWRLPTYSIPFFLGAQGAGLRRRSIVQGGVENCNGLLAVSRNVVS